MVFTGENSALTSAAKFATRGYWHSPCAPLLFLLRRVAADPQACAAQQGHMRKVMGLLCQLDTDDDDDEYEEKREDLFRLDRPDDERDACVCLLLEHGDDSLVMRRIITE
ncbi:hypothetical protein FOA52_009824 [Chlamydomonas sp. UWO 241]|nr:hypothetical protein FOA52_009824 [Chlamydomonas sp. UWO 241]